MNYKMRIKKTVLLTTVIGILICSLLGIMSGCQNKLDMKVLTSEINAGATEEFIVLHASDTHLTLCDDSDTKEIKDKAKNRYKRFKKLQEQKLDYVAALAKENDYLVVHTGDIMDFTTDANIARTKAFIEETNCLYVPGNHEMENITDYYREKLAAATPRDLSFFAEEIKGVMFVGIDNTDHKMTEEQLSKLKEVVDTGKPIILLVHVPLFTKDLYDVSILDDGSAYLMAVPEELMTNYPAMRYEMQKADEVTYRAYDYIATQTNIKGILCGHLHLDFETTVGGIPQYVVGLDSVRLVTIK